MWVFGYGSLMWDGWQDEYGCLRHAVADLPGYARVLNKASTLNWGTKQNPGPTLNIAPLGTGTCRGIAFEFSTERKSAVLEKLKARERGFDLPSVSIRLQDGNAVPAITAIYAKGPNLLDVTSPEDLAPLILAATGKDGTCESYVRNVNSMLTELGVIDGNIRAIVRELDRLAGESVH
jgi:glutathione-specific gamma-glutamylcyclotransferase